ncbi:hypothetical protein [Alkalihalobacterium bogoriense]|uniref:hypothetical protein n=1 Tax=Alkalihalobacterium bogoriense TaxID=246272 RepID=UPI0006846A66|nr:hypothetical protein [Alkalihalobacterium bogoriense]
MYRFISFLVITTFVSSVLYFYNESRHHHSSGHHTGHEEIIIHIPNDITPPTITGEVKQDASNSWLLKIETNHFTFTPEKTGLATDSFHEGHAHLYMNGERINRLYGPYYNLGDLQPGVHEIKVTLNANNHGVFVYRNNEIAFVETIEVYD